MRISIWDLNGKVVYGPVDFELEVEVEDSPRSGVFFFDKTPPKVGQFFKLERPEKFEKSLILRHLVERNHPRKFEIFQEMWLFCDLREANPPLRKGVALETFSYRGIAVQSCSKSHIS